MKPLQVIAAIPFTILLCIFVLCQRRAYRKGGWSCIDAGNAERSCQNARPR